MAFPNLFSPISINTLEVENRIVMTAMHLGYTPDGEVTENLVEFYVARARGGAGLITIGGCTIDPLAGMSNMVAIYEDRFLPGLQKLAREVKAHGARVALQLYQAGRYTHSAMIGGEKPISASAIRSRLTGETPRALGPEEIPGVQMKYAEAAGRAQRAGFDAVEILGSAGYLISQFLSPLTNVREDKYGGSLENRMRFGLEVVKRVREVVGPDYPIIMRLAGNDFMEGGNTNIEAAVFASELEKVGVDLFNVTGGWHETRIPQLTMSVPRGAYIYLARGIKAAVTVPVLGSNRINDPFMAEELLENGEVDMVTMARALLADPEMPNKARAGKSDAIYHCVACNQGCFDSIFQLQPVTCLVNPRAGKEGDTPVNPADPVKKVLVIGGGPAGMKAACTAAERGHQITLVEKDGQLGGQLLLNRKIPGRKEMVTAAHDLINNIKAHGVNTILNREVTVSWIKDAAPEAVILATGARPILPDLEGVDRRKVVMAWDILSGMSRAGNRVVIIGGNAVGLETALCLANQGTLSPEILHFLAANRAESWETLETLINKGDRDVTVVEMTKKAGRDIGMSTRWTIMAELRRLGVKILTGARALAVTENGLDITKDGKNESLQADTVVIAAGSSPENSLVQQLDGVVPEIHIIGDAKAPRNALAAIREGFLAGLQI
ncbi:FAD-dependent oxidoreductase [Thermodesulfobacteriota bacterium]